jgi:hypothetical protein
MQHKHVELESALSGRMRPHQQFLLQEQLALINGIDASIQRVNQEIARRLQAHNALSERLDAIPGIGRRIVQIILPEIGPDVAPLPSAAHLASWVGLCPAITRVPANSGLVGRGREIPGCGPRWSMPPRRPPASNIPTWAHSSAELQAGPSSRSSLRAWPSVPSPLAAKRGWCASAACEALARRPARALPPITTWSKGTSSHDIQTTTAPLNACAGGNPLRA